ncbi:MAG: histidine phosphatase family protein [Candidatus Poseidoniales archaeon]
MTFFLALTNVSLVSASDDLERIVASIDANVVFMRHALAPGTGDPENFAIEDCATQRNLSPQGRSQARQIGLLLKASFSFADIYSSEWCRCVETTRLLDLGEWETLSGLNSFYEGHVDRERTLNLLDRFLNSLNGDRLTLLVTHQVVISAVTGKYAKSGGLVFYNSKTKQSVGASLRY